MVEDNAEHFTSRFQCHRLMNDQAPELVAARLNQLIGAYGSVDPELDHWSTDLTTVQLNKPSGFDFLSDPEKQILTDWWLAVPKSSTTPQWGVVSTCTVEGGRGLVLIEAKIRVAELNRGGQSPSTSDNSQRNKIQIAGAIDEASTGLNAVLPGFSLSDTFQYQLANRFAWSWKLASMRIPVVLIYLGFVSPVGGANVGRQTFDSASVWEEAVHDYAHGFVPEAAWERTLDIGGTPFTPLIRSTHMSPIS